jgi:hypothetical protein
MNLAELNRLVLTTPDRILKMSRQTCHATNVSSIVIKRNPQTGALTRFFVAQPGHNLKGTSYSKEFEIGVHNHRYALNLIGVYGKVFHQIFRESEITGACKPIKKYKVDFTTGERTFIGDTDISLISKVELSKHPLHVSPKTIHTIAAEGPAVWVVEEGPVTNTDLVVYNNADPIGPPNEAFPSVNAIKLFMFDFYRRYQTDAG